MGRLSRLLRNLKYDLRYGGFLGGVIATRYPQAGAKDVANSDYGILPVLFRGLIRPDDVLVDVGCGKGRVINWWLQHHPHNRIIGVELDPQVAQSTARRLRHWPLVSIRVGDVVDVFPDEGTLFYLFNPFSLEVMERFVVRFLNAPPCASKRRVVYYNPVHMAPFLRLPAQFACKAVSGRESDYHAAMLITERPASRPPFA